MTKEESLAFRRMCPYDAMGDYSVFCRENEKREERPLGISKSELSVKETK